MMASISAEPSCCYPYVTTEVFGLTPAHWFDQKSGAMVHLGPSMIAMINWIC